MRRRIPDRYVRCDEKPILKPAKPVLLKESEGLLPLRFFPGCCNRAAARRFTIGPHPPGVRSQKRQKAFISGAFRPFPWPRRRRWRSRSTSPCSFFPSCACKNTWLPPQARCQARWRCPNRSYFLLLRSARSALRCRRPARPARTATRRGTAPTLRRARA